MSCNYKDTAILLRNWLFNSIEVGQYIFPEGLSSPALTIVGNRAKQSPAPGTEIKGIEAVIFYPEPQDSQYMGGVSSSDRWEIQIRQWDINGTTLEAKDCAIASCSYPIISAIRVNASGTTGQPEIYRLILEIAKYLPQNA